MLTRDSLFKLFSGLLCFSLQMGCSDDNDPLPKSSDITIEIKEDGFFAVVDVSVTGVSPDKIEECGIKWEIALTGTQTLIGEEEHTMKNEGGSLSYTFRIFPWSHFMAPTYYNTDCKIFATPYVRVNGQTIEGNRKNQNIKNDTNVYLWTHKSEVVDNSDIRLPGKFSNTGRLRIEECGVYWSENESDDLDDYTKCKSPDTTPDFSVTIPGIAHLKSVYMVGYTETSLGTFYSGPSKVYLPGDEVTISIDSEAKDVTFERLTVSAHCTVENPAAYPITERGFCYFPYSSSSSPTVNDSKVTVEPGNGAFTASITGLKPFTYYTIRAYAISNGRVTYSERINKYTVYSDMFTPYNRLNTAEVDPYQQGQVLLEGTITNDCGYMVTERGFCYNALGQTPTINHYKVIADGVGLGTFEAAVKLSPGKYFFKSYAINQAGVRYSSDYKEVVVK